MANRMTKLPQSTKLEENKSEHRDLSTELNKTMGLSSGVAATHRNARLSDD